MLNAYGITETGSWLAGTTVSDFTPEDGLVGEAWGGVIRVHERRASQVHLLDVGAVCAPERRGACLGPTRLRSCVVTSTVTT